MNTEQDLNTLAAMRHELVQLPEHMWAVILRELDPDTAARVAAIRQEFDDREAELTGEISNQEATIKAQALETGASAQGTYLQVIIVAPRITWDNKGMAAYAALHPDVLVYRKVGEPSAQIRARGSKG